MNNFTYYAPTKVIFGKGTESQVGSLVAAQDCKKVLLHYGSGSVKKTGLLDRVKNSAVTEIILATNPTVEGDQTALYIQHRLKDVLNADGMPCVVTRLASGLPVGGDLEYADAVTLARSFRGRVRI